MRDETAHYFGAYLEIEVEKVLTTKRTEICKNGHRNQRGNYCNLCGSELEILFGYPVWIKDIIGEAWQYVLATIYSVQIPSTGLILAIGNMDYPRGEWLWLDRDRGEIETKIFPTENEIRDMKQELNVNYQKVIVALEESPVVKRVEIKVGYVLCAEF